MIQALSMGARRSVVVRITHWLTAASFLALLVSGIAILLAHPRLYWGETGAIGAPSLVDLPLPMMLTGQSGWGRYLHFLSAWVSVLTGIWYISFGLATGHFRAHLMPCRADLSWRAFAGVLRDHWRGQLGGVDAATYNVVQRLTYALVVFVLSPVMIWTGLAMSPAVTAVFPALVVLLGGQQSARTIHFFDASALVVFLFVHIAMVCTTGFRHRMRAMLIGPRRAAGECA
jgi:thiosulfate reductase cytochrome b subunit